MVRPADDLSGDPTVIPIEEPVEPFDAWLAGLEALDGPDVDHATAARALAEAKDELWAMLHPPRCDRRMGDGRCVLRNLVGEAVAQHIAGTALQPTSS